MATPGSCHLRSALFTRPHGTLWVQAWSTPALGRWQKQQRELRRGVGQWGHGVACAPLLHSERQSIHLDGGAQFTEVRI